MPYYTTDPCSEFVREGVLLVFNFELNNLFQHTRGRTSTHTWPRMCGRGNLAQSPSLAGWCAHINHSATALVRVCARATQTLIWWTFARAWTHITLCARGEQLSVRADSCAAIRTNIVRHWHGRCAFEAVTERQRADWCCRRHVPTLASTAAWLLATSGRSLVWPRRNQILIKIPSDDDATCRRMWFDCLILALVEERVDYRIITINQHWRLDLWWVPCFILEFFDFYFVSTLKTCLSKRLIAYHDH